MDAKWCSVKSWAEFSLLNKFDSKLLLSSTEVFFSNGNEVFIFSTKHETLLATFHFIKNVSQLMLSERREMYVLCEDQGIYYVGASLLDRLLSPSDTVEKHPISENVTEDSILLSDKTISSFLLVGNLIITVSLQETNWTLSLYKFSLNSSTEPCKPRLSKLVDHSVLFIGQASPQSKYGPIECKGDGRPLLSCIYPSGSDACLGDLSTCLGCFPLEGGIFSLLFGVDAALVNSPVVLCGLPDGRLCYLPILLPVEPSSPVPGRSKGLRVLHSLEQPIMFVGAPTTMEAKDHIPRNLVVIGQQGRVLLLTASENGGEGKVVQFCEFSTWGPVVCACAHSNHVYYSTASDLLCFKLNGMQSPQSSSSSSDLLRPLDPPTPTPVSLNVSRIIAMTPIPNNPTGGAVELLALSHNGRLLRIQTPQETDRESTTRLSSCLAGQRMKDLLAAIGNVWERASALKSNSRQTNESLRRLNQVLNICSAMLTNQNQTDEAGDRQQPITCHGATSWTCVLQEDSLMLTCTLENNSGFSLEHGWCLCICVDPLSNCLTSGRENTSRTFTFPLQELTSGNTLNVTLPLGTASSLHLPISVNCSLLFSVGSVGSFEEPDQFESTEAARAPLLSNHQSECICLPLESLTVDLLDSFRLDTSQTQSLSRVSKPPLAPTDAIQAFLSHRMEPGRNPSVIEQRSSPCLAVVRMSVELLRAKLCTSGSVAEEHKGGEGLCVSALRWLLAGCDGIGRLRNLAHPTVMGRGPQGQAARITTKEVTLSAVTVDGPLQILEIQLESFSMATVCGLHYAVLRRIQVLLKSRKSGLESRVQLKEESLRKAMQHAEMLRKALQDALLPTSLGVAISGSRTCEKLLAIYQQLRESPLLIL